MIQVLMDVTMYSGKATDVSKELVAYIFKILRRLCSQ